VVGGLVWVMAAGGDLFGGRWGLWRGRGTGFFWYGFCRLVVVEVGGGGGVVRVDTVVCFERKRIQGRVHNMEGGGRGIEVRKSGLREGDHVEGIKKREKLRVSGRGRGGARGNEGTSC